MNGTPADGGGPTARRLPSAAHRTPEALKTLLEPAIYPATSTPADPASLASRSPIPPATYRARSNGIQRLPRVSSESSAADNGRSNPGCENSNFSRVSAGLLLTVAQVVLTRIIHMQRQASAATITKGSFRGRRESIHGGCEKNILFFTPPERPFRARVCARRAIFVNSCG
jgi:hypothetical protein